MCLNRRSCTPNCSLVSCINRGTTSFCAAVLAGAAEEAVGAVFILFLRDGS